MKKVFLLGLLACLALIVALFGCSKANKNTEAPPVFDTVSINESYYLFGDTSMPACNIVIDFNYPSQWNNRAEELKALQSLFVETNLGDKYKTLSPPEAARAYQKQYIANFKEMEVDDAYKDYFDGDMLEYEDETGYETYIILNNKILNNNKGFVSYLVEKTSYEGGAHSSLDVQGYVVKLNNCQLLDRDEFEGSNYRDFVSQLLARKIARSNNLSDPKQLENIGYTSLEDIVPTDNFTLDGKGITYYYNENDIAGAMMGVTEVFIPYDEIRIYLSADNPLIPLMK